MWKSPIQWSAPHHHQHHQHQHHHHPRTNCHDFAIAVVVAGAWCQLCTQTSTALHCSISVVRSVSVSFTHSLVLCLNSVSVLRLHGMSVSAVLQPTLNNEITHRLDRHQLSHAAEDGQRKMERQKRWQPSTYIQESSPSKMKTNLVHCSISSSTTNHYKKSIIGKE